MSNCADMGSNSKRSAFEGLDHLLLNEEPIGRNLTAQLLTAEHVENLLANLARKWVRDERSDFLAA